MKIVTLLTRGTCALALAVSMRSASAGPAPHTNAVTHISVALTFITQGPTILNSPHTNDVRSTAIRTSVTTKDVIAWLGAATTNNFPANARLVRVKHFNSNTNSTTIEVRFGTNSVDVTQFFSDSASSEKVDSNYQNTVTGLTVGKRFENFHLVYTNSASLTPAPYFHVNGAATVNYVTVKSGKTSLTADELSPTFENDFSGAGAGTNGVPALVTGSVTLSGTVTEVK